MSVTYTNVSMCPCPCTILTPTNEESCRFLITSAPYWPLSVIHNVESICVYFKESESKQEPNLEINSLLLLLHFFFESIFKLLSLIVTYLPRLNMAKLDASFAFHGCNTFEAEPPRLTGQFVTILNWWGCWHSPGTKGVAFKVTSLPANSWFRGLRFKMLRFRTAWLKHQFTDILNLTFMVGFNCPKVLFTYQPAYVVLCTCLKVCHLIEPNSRNALPWDRNLKMSVMGVWGC